MHTVTKFISLALLLTTLARFQAVAGEKSADFQKEALVFRGIAFERYDLPGILNELGVKKLKEYTITNRAPALTPENKFRLDKLPPINSKRVPQYIVMADFPLNSEVMPGIVQKSIIKDIKRGSVLVILGGLFTLNKGEFYQSQLATILPVKTEDPWAVKKLKTPLVTPGGAVVYVHDIPLVAGAKVLYESGSQPLWVAKKCEKGQVIVFLGIPSGTDKDAAGLFWKNQAWVKFATNMIIKGANVK